MARSLDSTSRPGRPRVLLVGLEWFATRPGGLNRYFADLVAALQAEGLDVRAVALGRPPRDLPGASELPGINEPLARRLMSTARAITRAGRSADVIDVHFVMNALIPLATGRLRGKPLVVHFHGPWAAESRASGQQGLRVAIKHRIEIAVYRRAAALVVLSQSFRKLLIDEYGAAPWRVHVLAPGVDTQHFHPWGDTEALRTGLGLLPHQIVVLAVRRLVPRMGLDTLLRSWAMLGAAVTKARLVVVGEGPSRSDLETATRELGIESTVNFVGRISDADLPAYYSAADVTIIPSATLEGFGLTALESLACGTPVIATDVGGLPEVVRPLAADSVVPPGDASALASRLLAVLNRSHPLPTAVRCRNYAKGFDWSAVAGRHDELYRAVAGLGQTQRFSVVYLDHCAQLSGGELALARLLAYLPDVDRHVILAEDGPLAGRLRSAGATVEVLRMPERSRALPRDAFRGHWSVASSTWATANYVRSLHRRLRELRPDVVHANSLKSCLYGGVAARAAGIPVIWHVRDRIAPDYLPTPAIALVRAAADRLPNSIIANSAATAATLSPSRRPLTVIPSPVSITTAERKRHGGELAVGMVGRLAPWKGQHVFLEAFARAFPNAAAKAVLLGSAMFGESEYEQYLHQLVHRLGIVSRTTFLGFRDDVGADLAEMDVLVHASTVPEPFGQVILEGMLAGVPVIAARAGGPAEILEDGVTGLLYEPGNVRALEHALRRVTADPQLAASLVARAKVATSAFAPEGVADAVGAVYRGVLGPGR